MKFPASVLLLFAFNFIILAPGQAVTPPTSKCNIRIDDPHISKSLLRTQGIRAVKINARSQCDKPMINLTLTVEIHKVGLFSDHRVRITSSIVRGFIAANQVIKNQKTYSVCISRKDSRYYGIAYATATINGKIMKTPKVISEKTLTFDCGN